MDTSKTILFIVILAFLSACSQDKTLTTSPPAAMPDLLDRPIQLTGVEWDKIQNSYQSYTKKITAKPVQSENYVKLAEVYMHEARVTGEHGHYYPAALQVLDIALQNEPKDGDQRFNALLYKASVMLSQHDFAQARDLALEAMKINTYNAQLYGTLVDAYLELGDYKKAVMMGDKMVSIRPDLRSYSRISYLREVHGDMDGAIEAMTLAAESGYPGLEQTAWSKLTLGDLYARKGDTKTAAAIYNQILVERENYPFAIAALGKLELDNKNYEKAEKLLLQAANIIPEVGYYTDLAQLYKATNQTDKYKKTTDEILVMLQDDIDSGHNMNLEYASFFMHVLPDLDQAMKYAKDEYNKRPKNVDVNQTMAEVHIARGEKVEAQIYIENALKINKNSEDLLGLKAQVSRKI